MIRSWLISTTCIVVIIKMGGEGGGTAIAPSDLHKHEMTIFGDQEEALQFFVDYNAFTHGVGVEESVDWYVLEFLTTKIGQFAAIKQG